MSDFLTDVEAAIPGLRRYALALTRDADAADDLVQDCLERALTRRRLWRPTGTVKSWLFTILHNQFISDRRRLNRRAGDLPMDDALQQSAPDNPMANVALAETARAIEALSIEQRTTLLLVAVEGLTYAEAAMATGVPVGTIMSRLARARRALANKMEAGPRLARVK
jgi:RNA polymerase sigma-70 factor (ECF subfamily)